MKRSKKWYRAKFSNESFRSLLNRAIRRTKEAPSKVEAKSVWLDETAFFGKGATPDQISEIIEAEKELESNGII